MGLGLGQALGFRGSAAARRLTGKNPRTGARIRWFEGQEARRRAASHAFRSLRRSSSDVPPHTPDSWLVARAKSRHGSSASQPRQTRLAASIWSMAGPVVPMGKNRSGSVFLQAARSRQSSSSHSTVRFQTRATLLPPSRAVRAFPIVNCFTWLGAVSRLPFGVARS